MSEHHCHWPGCEVEVPPKLWGCKSHWFRLPKYLRDRIWATYRPGQEITKDPSDEYMEAAYMVREWILKNTKPIVPKAVAPTLFDRDEPEDAAS